MPIQYDISKDPLYLQGMEVERAKSKEEIAKSKQEVAKSKQEAAKFKQETRELYEELLSLMSIEEIVKKFNVSEEYLRELKEAKDKQSEK